MSDDPEVAAEIDVTWIALHPAEIEAMKLALRRGLDPRSAFVGVPDDPDPLPPILSDPERIAAVRGLQRLDRATREVL